MLDYLRLKRFMQAGLVYLSAILLIFCPDKTNQLVQHLTFITLCATALALET